MMKKLFLLLSILLSLSNAFGQQFDLQKMLARKKIDHESIHGSKTDEGRR